MRIIVVAFVAALAAGCSTNVRLAASSGGSAAFASGTSVTTGPAGLNVRIDSLTAVVIAGVLIVATGDEARDARPFPSFSVFYDWTSSRPAPPLAPDRRVHEQDCSQPLEDPTANLKCR